VLQVVLQLLVTVFALPLVLVVTWLVVWWRRRRVLGWMVRILAWTAALPSRESTLVMARPTLVALFRVLWAGMATAPAG
jgi:hypothetical protein